MRGRRLLWLLLPLAVLGLDWGSKLWVLARLHPGEMHPVIPGFFNLTLGFNPGAIFGSFSNLPAPVRQGIFLVAGVLTPPDVVTQLVMALPL
ncbi:MAG TPA: signal peptidase II, partial [Holophaga sp.]|nr:signal peptidase II [Holophaga sp.]